MDENQGQAVDLREYLAVLRVRKWTIILITLLVTGSALFFSYEQTPLYKAQTRVLVKPLPTSPTDFYVLPPNLETESQVVQSTQVAALVAEDLGLDTPPDSLLGGLEVSLVTDSDVLVIDYTSPDPELAHAIADSFASNYIENRKAGSLEELDAARTVIQNRIATVQGELAELLEDLEEANDRGDSELATTLETQRSALVARFGVLQQRLDDLQPEYTIRSGAGQVLEPASTPATPASPDHIKNGILGFVLGLALGIGLAFLKERLDDRFRGQVDTEKALGAPVVAHIPRFRAPRKSSNFPVALLVDPTSLTAEAYRTLRTNVQFLVSQHEHKSVLVTSASAKEGKTTSVANLGVALAQVGRRVILISADLRRPQLKNYFDLPQGEVGLSTWLAGQHEDPLPLVQATGVENLKLLPAGPVPPNPSELLNSPRMADLVRRLEQICDLIVIDSPPALGISDAPTIAAMTGAPALLVIDSANTHRSAVIQAKKELEAVGTQIIGSVMNNFDPGTSAYYSAYQAYSTYGGYAPSVTPPEPEKKRRGRRKSKEKVS